MANDLPPNASGITFTPFDYATQGSVLASKQVSVQSLTFSGVQSLAVYRNALGTLDFYYQFARTGPGSLNDHAVEMMTGADYAGFDVDAFYTDQDPDGAGIFVADGNPGSPATARRNWTGGVVAVNFDGINPVAGTETSAVYIFRTNARRYTTGSFGVIDGSSAEGLGYAPSAVPESGAWAMMIVGFGAVGGAMRRRRRTSTAMTA